MPVKYYEGERVYFRPLDAADVPKLVEWLNDPQNWKTLRRMSPLNQLREKEYLEGLYKSNTEVVLGITLQENDELIGSCGLGSIDPGSRSAAFGMVIGKRACQGLALGTAATRLMLKYAFCELNLNRVSLEVLSDNDRGVAAYRRAGFVQEGRSREGLYRNGRYHDVLHFAILRNEWKTGRQADRRGACLASMTV